jgi:hypothetical protein
MYVCDIVSSDKLTRVNLHCITFLASLKFLYLLPLLFYPLFSFWRSCRPLAAELDGFLSAFLPISDFAALLAVLLEVLDLRSPI